MFTVLFEIPGLTFPVAVLVGFCRSRLKAESVPSSICVIGNRNAASVVQTAIQHVATTARMETLKANSDVVLGYRWVSTLDRKTSQQCRGLDGMRFDLGKGPLPPARCRSPPGMHGATKKLSRSPINLWRWKSRKPRARTQVRCRALDCNGFPTAPKSAPGKKAPNTSPIHPIGPPSRNNSPKSKARH